jgi:hypothetical protein
MRQSVVGLWRWDHDILWKIFVDNPQGLADTKFT